MSNAKLTIGHKVKLVNVSETILSGLKEAATLPNPQYVQARGQGRYTGRLDAELLFWEPIPGGITLPRGCTRKVLQWLHKHGVEPDVVDNRRTLDPVSFDFSGDLRPYQLEAVRGVARREFGVLEASTGSGKTVMALAVIALRQQPTLILVHSKELLHQWAQRIEAFLGVQAGLIGDGKFDVQPVSVAVVNTARKHLHSLPVCFGHLVVDECHRAPSAMFSEVVSAFDCRFMLGLSATPYRRDGLGKLIYMALGDRTQLDPAMLQATGAVLKPEVIRRTTVFKYDYADDYAQMLTSLTEDEDRNRQIAGDVVRQARSGSGTALVVSDRVAHCGALAELVRGAGCKVELLTGRASQRERGRIVGAVQAGQVDVLCSTTQLLSEGFDCAGLDSLFLASPIKFRGRLVQVAGRVLRPADGKRARVFDYIDANVGVLAAQAKSRRQALESLQG